jgi:hypothetical protein
VIAPATLRLESLGAPLGARQQTSCANRAHVREIFRRIDRASVIDLGQATAQELAIVRAQATDH